MTTLMPSRTRSVTAARKAIVSNGSNQTMSVYTAYGVLPPTYSSYGHGEVIFLGITMWSPISTESKPSASAAAATFFIAARCDTAAPPAS